MKRFGHLLLAGVLGSALTLGTYSLMTKDEAPIRIENQQNVPVSRVVYTMDNNGDMVPLDFTQAAETVTKAVVSITSTSVSNSSGEEIPEEFREFFGPFFSPRQGQEGPRVGSGSGVIISEDGYIVTNNHVIDNSDEIKVRLNDNRTYIAELIGTDPTTDIAVIKIEEDEALPYLRFASSEQVRVGEWVLAVGNPFMLYSTVTAGIVSAKARAIGILNTSSESNQANESIESFIQTDAAVNPGNSGGALVDLQGGLIGINTAIQSPTGAYSGYSFAVPSDIVKKVVEDILEYGTVQRGWLGVVITSVNEALIKENDLEVVSGAYITDLAESSGARDAGIKPGDVIIEIDGRKMETNSQVIGYIGQKRPGDKVNIVVDRFGKTLDFKVELKNRSGSTQPVAIKDDMMSKLGIELEELEARDLKRLDLENGVKVTDIRKGGLIDRETSMREGFIITSIGGKTVSSAREVKDILESSSGGVLIEGRYEEYSKREYYALGLN